jgi:HK97 family phage prohead protease
MHQMVNHQPFEVKALEDGTLVISGYASTFGNIDRHGDIIDPSAFDETMERYMESSILLAFHNQKMPIGMVSEAHIDEKGLYVVGQIPESPDPQIQGVRKMIEKGILRSFSIGGYFHREKGTHGNVIRKVDLVEISVVSVPANPLASFSVQEGKEVREIETKDMTMEAKDVSFECWAPTQPPTLLAQIEVEGENTPVFLGYMTGIPIRGYKYYQFAVQAKSESELKNKLRSIENYVNRARVRAVVKSPVDWRSGDGEIDVHN